MTRGFVFSLDVVMGGIAVILMLLFLAHSIQPTSPNSHVLLQVQAKDAALAWFYSSPTSTGDPSPPLNKQYACDTAFRMHVTTEPIDIPFDSADWVVQKVCVVAP